jgi:uncharacterized protein (TIGR02145 family)
MLNYEALLDVSHPRAKDLFNFVTSSPEIKVWYFKNHEKIQLVDEGIEIQGLTFFLENEKAADNGTDIVNYEGNTYFTFDAAQRHAAEQGRRVPTDAEWQKLNDFLPEGQVARFFLDVLKVSLSGYKHSGGFTFGYRGVTAHLWSSSEGCDSTAYYRYLHYGYAKVNRNYNFKKFGFGLRCVKN